MPSGWESSWLDLIDGDRAISASLGIFDGRQVCDYKKEISRRSVRDSIYQRRLKMSVIRPRKSSLLLCKKGIYFILVQVLQDRGRKSARNQYDDLTGKPEHGMREIKFTRVKKPCKSRRENQLVEPMSAPPSASDATGHLVSQRFGGSLGEVSYPLITNRKKAAFATVSTASKERKGLNLLLPRSTSEI